MIVALDVSPPVTLDISGEAESTTLVTLAGASYEAATVLFDEYIKVIGLEVSLKTPDKVVTFRGINTLPVKFVHPSKLLYISVTLFGISGACISPVQPKKALDILVTLFGISGACISPVQPEKALDILVTLFGISVTCISPVQP